MKLHALFLLIAAINGVGAVALGAFGAHALKSRLNTSQLDTWQTAVQYHFYHLFALAILALVMNFHEGSKALSIGGWLFVTGIVLFCGSLYGLALGGPKILGPITPIGGLCFMGGWLYLAVWASALLAE